MDLQKLSIGRKVLGRQYCVPRWPPIRVRPRPKTRRHRMNRTRRLALALLATTGCTFVIDNKPGAGGNLGVDAVAKSPADGYTIVIGQTSNLAINPTLYAKMPYDSLKDLAPIVLLANAPLVMVTAVNTPHKTLADAVNAARAKPGQLNFASPGN